MCTVPDNITHIMTIETRVIPSRMTNPSRRVNFDRFMVAFRFVNVFKEGSGSALPSSMGIISEVKPNFGG
jgi:hypothetical protein